MCIRDSYKTTPYPFERYCENFAGLSALAQEYGLLLCQENVVRCKCGSVDLSLIHI